jgi:hypothetical protein
LTRKIGRQAGQEGSTVAEEASKPSAGYQQDGVGEDVGGDGELQLAALARSPTAMDGTARLTIELSAVVMKTAVSRIGRSQVLLRAFGSRAASLGPLR